MEMSAAQRQAELVERQFTLERAMKTLLTQKGYFGWEAWQELLALGGEKEFSTVAYKWLRASLKPQEWQ